MALRAAEIVVPPACIMYFFCQWYAGNDTGAA